MWPSTVTGTSLPIVPVAERGDVLGERFGQNERVDERVMGEQAAVVGRDVHVVIALVDAAEETEEVAPHRLRIEFVDRLERPFEQAVAHQVAALGEGDEQDAVENLLRRLDRRGQRELRPVGRVR